MDTNRIDLPISDDKQRNFEYAGWGFSERPRADHVLRYIDAQSSTEGSRQGVYWAVRDIVFENMTRESDHISDPGNTQFQTGFFDIINSKQKSETVQTPAFETAASIARSTLQDFSALCDKYGVPETIAYGRYALDTPVSGSLADAWRNNLADLIARGISIQTPEAHGSSADRAASFINEASLLFSSAREKIMEQPCKWSSVPHRSRCMAIDEVSEKIGNFEIDLDQFPGRRVTFSDKYTTEAALDAARPGQKSSLFQTGLFRIMDKTLTSPVSGERTEKTQEIFRNAMTALKECGERANIPFQVMKSMFATDAPLSDACTENWINSIGKVQVMLNSKPDMLSPSDQSQVARAHRSAIETGASILSNAAKRIAQELQIDEPSVHLRRRDVSQRQNYEYGAIA